VPGLARVATPLAISPLVHTPDAELRRLVCTLLPWGLALATRSRGCYFQVIASRSKDENCLLECRQCREADATEGGPAALLSLVASHAGFSLYGWHWQLLSLEVQVHGRIDYYYFRWPRAGVALTGRLSRALLRYCNGRMLLPRAHSHCTSLLYRPGPGPGGRMCLSPHHVSLAGGRRCP
jgi:hypothetical protein